MRFLYVPVGLDSIEGKCIGLLRVCVFVCVFMYTHMHEQVCIFIKQVRIFLCYILVHAFITNVYRRVHLQICI